MLYFDELKWLCEYSLKNLSVLTHMIKAGLSVCKVPVFSINVECCERKHKAYGQKYGK